MQRSVLVDGNRLRYLIITEGFRLFGFPEDYQINLSINKTYDLLENRLVVTVVREITTRIIINI
jgi:DNA (cytosine-5)-methyltransferase 1